MLWVSGGVCIVIAVMLLGLALRFQPFHDLGLNLASNAIGLAAGLGLVHGYIESRARKRRNAVLRWAMFHVLHDAYMRAKLIRRENRVSEERGTKVLEELEPQLLKCARAITRKARSYQGYLDVKEYGTLELIVDALLSLGRGHVRKLDLKIEPYVEAIIQRTDELIRDMGDARMKAAFKILEIESPLRGENEG